MTEIRYRVRNPKAFDPLSFRHVPLSPSQGIYSIMGKIPNRPSMVIQSLRFQKSKGWTESKASSWARSHQLCKYPSDLRNLCQEGLGAYKPISQPSFWSNWFVQLSLFSLFLSTAAFLKRRMDKS